MYKLYLRMFMKLIFRKNNIVCIRVLSLLIVKTNNLTIFSGSDTLCINVFLRCLAMEIAVAMNMGTKIAAFYGCNNTYLI